MMSSLSVLVGRLRTALYLLRLDHKKAQTLRTLSQSPIVIGGCGRSGTSLLLTLLSCHPDIVAIESETGGLCPRKSPKKFWLNPPIRLWLLYRELVNGEIPDTAKRWCEKTPRNALNYSAILEYFGSSVRILNIVRDGRDVISSTHPTIGVGDTLTSYKYWKKVVSLSSSFDNHPQVYTLRYEDLVASPEATLRDICDFLELEYVEEFSLYPESAKLKTHSGFQSGAKPISNKSIGRWKQPQNHDRVEKLMSDPVCVKLLRHYGYLDP